MNSRCNYFEFRSRGMELHRNKDVRGGSTGASFNDREYELLISRAGLPML